VVVLANHNFLLMLLFTASIVTPLFITEERLETAPCICVLHNLTGRECPSCGLTRSFVALTDGRFRDAVLFHPAGPVIFALFAILAFGLALTLLRVDTPVHRFFRKHPYLPVTVGTVALIEGYILKTVMI